MAAAVGVGAAAAAASIGAAVAARGGASAGTGRGEAQEEERGRGEQLLYFCLRLKRLHWPLYLKSLEDLDAASPWSCEPLAAWLARVRPARVSSWASLGPAGWPIFRLMTSRPLLCSTCPRPGSLCNYPCRLGEGRLHRVLPLSG
jgi:hypothetical protein